MKKRIVFKLPLLLLAVLVVGYGIYYAWYAFPIISGYSAKNACSCAFLQGRTKEMINKEELGSFPLSLGSIDIDPADSSVTGSVWGLAKRKAVYRKGLGCTLVNEISEQELRAQHYLIPAPQAAQDSIDWPMGDRMAVGIDSGIDRVRMNEALAFVFNHQYKKKEAHTRALVIVHKGKIVAEKYGTGYDQNSPFLGWSMAKSITATLIGILEKQGRLKAVAAAPLEEWKNTKKNAITTEQLLQQTSGLDFVEDYASYSNVTNMLFNKGNMAAYVAGLSPKQAPGTKFYYSSGNSNLLSLIVRRTVGEQNHHAFPYTALFYKIGMYHSLLEPDASGTFVGSSYVFATARDYARFGLLYLNDGLWNGERILPEGWVKRTVTPSSADQSKSYGYQFWLNGFSTKDPSRGEYPEMPADMFYADGFGGQRIYIVPSKELVIVRMGLNPFDEHVFLSKVMVAL